MITNYSMAASRSLSSASRIFAGLVSAIAAAMLLAMPTIAAAQSTDRAPAGWKLVWSDEFEGDAIDRAKWDFDLGNGFYNYEANTWISGWGTTSCSTTLVSQRTRS